MVGHLHKKIGHSSRRGACEPSESVVKYFKYLCDLAALIISPWSLINLIYENKPIFSEVSECARYLRSGWASPLSATVGNLEKVF